MTSRPPDLLPRTLLARAIAPVLTLVAVSAGAWLARAEDETTTDSKSATERVPGLPRVVHPKSNPSTPEKIQLGERLFRDVRLSESGKVSCATCHLDDKAFADDLPKAEGVWRRPGRRNVPTLWNVAFLPHLFWDGRAPSLEEQARQPFSNWNEYGFLTEADFLEHALQFQDDYAKLFERAFGDSTMTVQRMARAIAAFERTLVLADSPFDRWWAGDANALTEPQKRGYRLFIDKGNCVQCHPIRQSHALFTDGSFHNTGAGKGAGLRDKGRMETTGRKEDFGKFRTPTLRNVALTAPYMHDGSQATLEEVVKFYVDGGAKNPNLSELMRPVELSEAEQKDLVAFLHALTSPQRKVAGASCRRLLEEGKTQEAFDAFRNALERDEDDLESAVGLADAALALNTSESLATAERHLRKLLARKSPKRAHDGSREIAEGLHRLALVYGALAPLEEAMGLALQEDALIALRRIRDAGGFDVAAHDYEARLLLTMGRLDDAIEMLDGVLAAHPDQPLLEERRAALRYRRGWDAFSTDETDTASRADLLAAAEAFRKLTSSGHDISDIHMLFRAYAHHWTKDTDGARAAYRDAVAREAVAEKALQGLRNVLWPDLAAYRAELAALSKEHPGSAAVVYFHAYEELLQERWDSAEALLRRRLELDPTSTGGPLRYLGRIHAQRGERAKALDHYARALRLLPRDNGLITEYDTYLASRELHGWDDVDALVAEYRAYLDAGPRTPRFQILARNNLAFRLRDVATSFASRGPARIHTFPEGAPAKALETAKLSLAFYEEAVALIPENLDDASFADVWMYAGVHNDTGLMYHYVKPLQDLAKAERHYLRAFDMTDGAYQDTYYYNIQFLYGFELEGKSAKWRELAEIAKDAILKEDPESDTGYSPDPFKRTAARRDFERLDGALRKND